MCVCVCDPSELTAGGRSVSAQGHQSGVRLGAPPTSCCGPQNGDIMGGSLVIKDPREGEGSLSERKNEECTFKNV